MGKKDICKVHGEKNANECQNLSAKDAGKLGKPELTVDPENCSCDVGVTGPAGDPVLLAKNKPPILNPHPQEAKGPGR